MLNYRGKGNNIYYGRQLLSLGILCAGMAIGYYWLQQPSRPELAIYEHITPPGVAEKSHQHGGTYTNEIPLQTPIMTTAKVATSTGDIRVSPNGNITLSYKLHSNTEENISLSGILNIKDCPKQYIITDIVATSKGGTSWTAQLKEIDVSGVVITTSHIELELQDGRITDLRYDQQLCTQ